MIGQAQKSSRITSGKSHCLAELSDREIEVEMKNKFNFENCNVFKKFTRIKSFVMIFIGNLKLKMQNKDLVTWF